MDVAFDRELPGRVTPRARARLTGAWDDPVFLAELERQGQILARQPHATIRITARDGEALIGHWFPCPHPKRIVIAMHGWRSSWNRDFGTLADFFRRNGCSVLYPEQRGQNGSGGQYMGLGMLERYDCLDWIRWAVAKNPALPIFLGGVSMGATTVLMAAGLSLPHQVKGIIADCGFTSPREISRHVLKNNLHLSYRLRAHAADNLCRKKIQLDTGGCSTVEALASSTVPVLLIHGAKDSFVPISMTYENYCACRGPRELLVIPDADHGMSHYRDPVRYESAIRAFWKRWERPFS